MSFKLSAQDPSDSLKKRIDRFSGREKFDATLDYVRSIYLDNIDSALFYTEKAIAIGVTLEDSIMLSDGYRIKGLILIRSGRIYEAMKILLECDKINRKLNYAENDKKVYTSLGVAHGRLGEYDKSIFYHQKAFNASIKESDITYAGISLNNIGYVHYKIKNYSLAEKFFSQSITYQLKLPKEEQADLQRGYANLGLSIAYQNRIIEGTKYIKRAIKECENNGCTPDIRLEAIAALGICYFLESNFEKAKEVLDNVYTEFEKRGDKRFMCEVLVFQIRIAIRKHEYGEAENLIAKGERLAVEGKFAQQIMDIARERIELDIQTGNVSMKLAHQKRYLQLRDSVVGNEVTMGIIGKTNQILRAENTEYSDSNNFGLMVLLFIVTATASLILIVYIRYLKLKRLNQQAIAIIKND